MKSEMDWQAGEAMQDKEKMVLLCVVSEGPCPRTVISRSTLKVLKCRRCRRWLRLGFWLNPAAVWRLRKGGGSCWALLPNVTACVCVAGMGRVRTPSVKYAGIYDWRTAT